MKSRISIDVDQDNQPIIKIDHVHSADVRDKLVKKFLEAFGTMSSWCKVDFNPIYQDPSRDWDVNTVHIRPISPAELPEHIAGMAESETLRQDFFKLQNNESKKK